MTLSVAAMFQSVKRMSLFKAFLPDSNDSNRSNPGSPNSSISAAEAVPPAGGIWDIEANLHSQPSASPLSNSDHPTTPTIRRSFWPRQQLLPILRRTSIAPQSNDGSSATSQSREEDISHNNNPIAKLFQEQDLGKTMIASVVPMTVAFLSPYAPPPGLVRILICSSLALGLVALWNGILLRRVLLRRAITIEQTGAGLVLVAYCGLISSLLPDYLVWIPCFCFLLGLIPFFWSYYLDRIAHR